MSRFESGMLSVFILVVGGIAASAFMDYGMLETTGIWQQIYQRDGIVYSAQAVLAMVFLGMLGRIADELRKARVAMELLSDEAAASFRDGEVRSP